jgi:hypothetical protein
MFVCLSVWLFVCIIVCMYLCLSVWLFVCMIVCMYDCLSVWLFVCILQKKSELSLETSTRPVDDQDAVSCVNLPLGGIKLRFGTF